MSLCAVLGHCDFLITQIEPRHCDAQCYHFENSCKLVQKMATTEYSNVTGSHKLNNSASPQDHIARDNDPVLDPAHQHHHGHLHHDVPVEKDNEDEVVYSIGSAIDKSTIPDQTTHDYDVPKSDGNHRTNIEFGDPQSQKPLGSYARYRIFFHLFIWFFFTG